MLQTEMLAALAGDAGVAHFVCDAEVEWDVAKNHEAAALAKRIRAAVGASSFVADAPWPLPAYIPGSRSRSSD